MLQDSSTTPASPIASHRNGMCLERFVLGYLRLEILRRMMNLLLTISLMFIAHHLLNVCVGRRNAKGIWDSGQLISQLRSGMKDCRTWLAKYATKTMTMMMLNSSYVMTATKVFIYTVWILLWRAYLSKLSSAKSVRWGSRRRRIDLRDRLGSDW